MRRRLLIVEDSELNLDLLVQIFEDSYDLTLASDGEAAVALAASASPDAILMDIGLPGISGIDAVRAIRGAGYEGPIIAVSSHVMPEELDRALAAGCDEFVAKPIDDRRLREIVTRLLGRG
jgi:two-component system, cell cycle response regulator DivK